MVTFRNSGLRRRIDTKRGLVRIRCQRDPHEGDHGQIECGWIGINGDATDRPAGRQASDALVHGRSGKLHDISDIGQRAAGVFCKKTNDFAVC
ncbi:hypothetical protein D3C87_1517730 [compost metagenome]